MEAECGSEELWGPSPWLTGICLMTLSKSSSVKWSAVLYATKMLPFFNFYQLKAELISDFQHILLTLWREQVRSKKTAFGVMTELGHTLWNRTKLVSLGNFWNGFQTVWDHSLQPCFLSIIGTQGLSSIPSEHHQPWHLRPEGLQWRSHTVHIPKVTVEKEEKQHHLWTTPLCPIL